MCFGGGGGGGNSSPSTPSGNPAPVNPATNNAVPGPAPTPKAPLPPADEPEIGKRRREETRSKFGQDRPSYRVRRDGAQPKIGPDGPIRM